MGPKTRTQRKVEAFQHVVKDLLELPTDVIIALGNAGIKDITQLVAMSQEEHMGLKMPKAKAGDPDVEVPMEYMKNIRNFLFYNHYYSITENVVVTVETYFTMDPNKLVEFTLGKDFRHYSGKRLDQLGGIKIGRLRRAGLDRQDQALIDRSIVGQEQHVLGQPHESLDPVVGHVENRDRRRAIERDTFERDPAG